MTMVPRISAAIIILMVQVQAASVASAAASPPAFFKSKSSSSRCTNTDTNNNNNKHHNKHKHKSLLLLQSSNAVNKLYARPPHDVRLYDELQVRSNATLAEIQKSWRRSSREWHPDKVAVRRRMRKRRRQEEQVLDLDLDDETTTTTTILNPPPPPSECETKNKQHDQNSNSDDEEEEEYARQKLAQLTKAYEILSDDHTRMLYHRYGLIGGTDAAIRLLTGTGTGREQPMTATEEQGRLLELMGYPPGGYSTTAPLHSRSSSGASYTHYHGHHHHHNHHHAHSNPSQQQQWHQQHHHSQHSHSHNIPSHSPQMQHQQRLAYLASTITERLRPLVEGTISQEMFVNEAYRECQALKKSALGAQILRCIGRGYRIEGYRVLRTMHDDDRKRRRRRRSIMSYGTTSSYYRGGRSHHYNHHHYRGRKRKGNAREVTDRVHDTWRDAKHYASAALASGKLMVMEHRITKLEEERVRQKQERERRRMEEKEEKANRIQQIGRVSGSGDDSVEEGGGEDRFAYDIGDLHGEESEYDDDYIVNDIGVFSDDENEDIFGLLDDDENEEEDELEQELRHAQHQKTYAALHSVHQMEALWKITKIELDGVIREACRSILDYGDDAFCPPGPLHRGHHVRHRRHNNHHRRTIRGHRPDGWVSTAGEGVTLEVGRLRAAAAMILVGDIMVECSKDGTGWKKKQ